MTPGVRLQGWVTVSRLAAVAYAALAASISIVALASGEARGSTGIAVLAAALVLHAVWLLGRAPFVGVWVGAEAVVVRGWFRTTVLDRGRPVDVRAARYDGALVRGRSALLWYLVVHGPDHEERPLRVTVTTQRRALQRCREHEDVLTVRQPA